MDVIIDPVKEFDDEDCYALTEIILPCVLAGKRFVLIRTICCGVPTYQTLLHISPVSGVTDVQ